MADKTENCGCEVRWSNGAEVAGIDYCPMHKAAPEMLVALRGVAAEIQAYPYAGLSYSVGGAMDKALAAARDQEAEA